MKFIKAFLQITRWQNLLFIAITQLLFHYCILIPNLLLSNATPAIHGKWLMALVLASVCIAAAGNIINDYFDLNIDKINKPDKLVIGKFISRRNAIILHLLLSTVGIGCSFYVSKHLNSPLLFIANIIAVLLLFIYSSTLKKKFLIGNVLVSALTSWVILSLVLPELYYNHSILLRNVEHLDKIFRIAVLYASFSFIVSLIREVVKDMEDADGDRMYGCKTLPIVLGINAAKVFAFVWLIVIAALLSIAQLYVVKYKWWLSIAYAIVLLIIPTIYIFNQLLQANNSKEFHAISSKIKWLMLFGILSMFFFKYYM